MSAVMLDHTDSRHRAGFAVYLFCGFIAFIIIFVRIVTIVFLCSKAAQPLPAA